MGETSVEEAAYIKNNIATDPAYKKYYEQFKTIWDTSKNLAAQSTVDENEAWQRFISRVSYQQQSASQLKKNNFSWTKMAAAVAVLIAVAFTAFIIFNNQPAPREITFKTLQQALNDTLPDNTVVVLNKNSTLAYPEKFKGKTRPVRLNGEAFFNVAPNKEKPFIITVNDLTVTVVGTSFNIKATNGHTDIVVETGIVQVTQNGTAIELKAGEKLSTSRGNTAPVKDAATDKLYNYYITKEFVCDNTPLWKLVEVLNEAYTANIVIANSAIRTLPITTTFYNDSLDNVLLIITETLNITVTKKDNTIILQ